MDDDGPTVVFDPDRLGMEPCPHLAFLWAALEVRGGRRRNQSGWKRHSSGAWLWEHGRGLHPHRGARDEPISGYLLDLTYGCLEPEARVTEVAYQVVGGTAEQREEIQAGTGHVRLTHGKGNVLHAELHGWAIYSPLAGRFADAVRRLIGRHT